MAISRQSTENMKKDMSTARLDNLSIDCLVLESTALVASRACIGIERRKDDKRFLECKAVHSPHLRALTIPNPMHTSLVTFWGTLTSEAGRAAVAIPEDHSQTGPSHRPRSASNFILRHSHVSGSAAGAMIADNLHFFWSQDARTPRASDGSSAPDFRGASIWPRCV